nr:vegetative incompatibility protein het-e-1 [Quercus suber]
MNAEKPGRKRDLPRQWFKRLAPDVTGTKTTGQASTSTTQGNGNVRTVITLPLTASLQTSVISRSFLTDTLEKLTVKERALLQEHTASSIDDAVQAAFDAAETQKQICEDRSWPGRDILDKMLCWLDRFKFAGDIAANVDPIHFGLPWAGIRILLEIAVADRRQMMALISGMELALCFANRLRAYFAHFQGLPSALTTTNFRNALIALYAQILRFLCKAILVFTMNTAVRKFRVAWQTSDLAAFESECDKLAQRVDIEAHNCDRLEFAQWRADLEKGLQELNRIRNLQNSVDILGLKAVLSNLAPVRAAVFNSFEEGQSPCCLDWTRTELLVQISQWAYRSDGKYIFWLCGAGATGKSTISRTFAQALYDQQRLGASFFFRRGCAGRSDASRFFPTVVAQLVDKIPAIQQHVANAIERDSFLCSSNLRNQFEKLFMEPLLGLKPTKLPPTGLTIVIDGLDECNCRDARTLLDLLAEVQARSNLLLRIFVTSRPKLPIEFGSKQIDGTLHEDVVLEDAQVTTIESDLRIALPEDWPSRQEIEALVSLASPLFIFASTVCRFVGGKNPQKRLHGVLQQQHPVASLHLSDEHSQLRLIYSQVLQQVFREEGENNILENIRMFGELVGPTILLADPLPCMALATLLQIDGEELENFLDGLRSVLRVPKDRSGPVQMLHLSFREFLLDQRNTDNQDLGLAKCRLTQSSHSDVWNDLSIREPCVRTFAASGNRDQNDMIFHGQQIYDNGEAHQFLQKHFLHWLEALSWLDRLSSTITYLGCLQSLTQGENSREVAAFLEDARRFVLNIGLVIDMTPLQTYQSAVMFVPTHSIVRETYRLAALD